MKNVASYMTFYLYFIMLLLKGHIVNKTECKPDLKVYKENFDLYNQLHCVILTFFTHFDKYFK